jgi:hypothetical protein
VKTKGIKDRSRTTQELKWVAGILRVSFINIVNHKIELFRSVGTK